MSEYYERLMFFTAVLEEISHEDEDRQRLKNTARELADAEEWGVNNAVGVQWHRSYMGAPFQYCCTVDQTDTYGPGGHYIVWNDDHRRVIEATICHRLMR